MLNIIKVFVGIIGGRTTLVNLSHKTVERLFYFEAEKQINLKKRYAQVRKLGIDEISHHKGKKNYVYVLVDLERGIQLDVLPNRKKETLIAHFQSLGEEFCHQIEVVTNFNSID